MTDQADAAAAAVADGKKKKIRKIRHFIKPAKAKVAPKTSKPRYEHTAVTPVSEKRNEFKIIRGSVTSDKATRKLEDENTMVFWVDLRAKKPQIRKAINKLYHVSPVNISTIVTSKCLKKAYVRLPSDFEAINIANEMGG
jgi:large subunit ribosomal protein L23Ae